VSFVCFVGYRVYLKRSSRRGEGAAHTSGDEGVAATFPHHEPYCLLCGMGFLARIDWIF
jgi:hypothetical protein